MSDENKIQTDDVSKQQEKTPSDSAGTTRDAGMADPQLPPPSFSMHVGMLATQAMVALGQMADPVQGKIVVRKNLARHYIDTLAMLEEKTKGQLTSSEAAMLQAALHDLRMVYVQVK